MRIRILPLALVAALSACNGSLVEPEFERAESSVLMGGGARTEEPTDSASTSSVYMGGGNGDGEPAERNPFLGGSGG